MRGLELELVACDWISQQIHTTVIMRLPVLGLAGNSGGGGEVLPVLAVSVVGASELLRPETAVA